MKTRGYPVVLTADRTLMAGYRLLFDGMLASSQTSSVPPALLSRLLMPWPPNGDIRALVAPLGLRRIESALLASGFSRDELAVVDERHLRQAIGPDTRVVALTSGEPTGKGMNSSTMTGIAGGEIFPQIMFRKMLAEVRRCVAAAAPEAKVVIGGPGAWQFTANTTSARELGIDHVVTGYAEGNAAEVFRSIVSGQKLQEMIPGQPVEAGGVPPIVGASTMGVVEISRGCGLGCSFCTIAQVPMMHLPEKTILADAATNVAAGITSIAALSEDSFRYGGKGLIARPDGLISLLEGLRRIDGLRLIQIDHANVSSIAQYSDDQLRAVFELMVGDTGCTLPWVNVGVETASGELLTANGGAAKMRGCDPDTWGEFSRDQLRRLCRAGFLPMVSLILGLPGEQAEDVRRTMDWVDSLRDERITIFPVIYAPVDGSAPPTPSEMKAAHWQLIKASYKLNFRWIPRMYWENQAGAGVSASRRTLMQVVGRGQVLQWNALFAWHSRRARA